MDASEALAQALKKAGIPHGAYQQVALAVEAHLQSFGFSVQSESLMNGTVATATMVHEIYSSFESAGFDEMQAFDLTRMIVEKQIEKDFS